MRAEGQSLLTAAEYYDERHARGWMDFWPESKKRRVIELVRQAELPDGARVLDYGCGVGVFAGAVKRAFPSLEVHGCDISLTGVTRAGAQWPEVAFHHLRGGAGEPPLGTYDLVYTHHVLEHVQDLGETLRHIGRLLRPGGKVLHVVPCANTGSLEDRISRLRAAGADSSGCFCCDDSSHVRRLSSRELTEACRAQGLILRQAVFANQFWGTLDYFMDQYHRTLIEWLTPSQGATRVAKVKLAVLMPLVVGLALLRQSPRHVAGRLRRAAGFRDMAPALLAVPVAALMYPASLLADGLIRALRDWEWARNRRAPNGSEMYCLFERAGC
jgi:2-polyprenyl-3-methyl-5-hydroxy-6-metoxy-1,4-benzoquinol methylase